MFPATGFIDVVLRAGELAGCPVIDELVLHTPLVLVEHAPTDVQIMVHPLEAARGGGLPCTPAPAVAAPARRGRCTPRGVERRPARLVAPPAAPQGIEAIDVDSFYARLAEHGCRYGGPFRSLRGIGHDPTDPDVMYARVELPADTDVAGYGVHPALLDAALHPLAAGFLSAADGAESAAPRLPFAFSGISLHATAATALRCRADAHRRGHLPVVCCRSGRGAGDQHRHRDAARGDRGLWDSAPRWPRGTACSS